MNTNNGKNINPIHKFNDCKKISEQIRRIAINAPNRDVMSCEFGNWFVPQIEKYLKTLEN